MDRIIRGVMKYRKCHREEMVKQFQQVRDHPEPKAVFFTCMDSRMIPTRFTETNVGDMFVVRNAGNIVPNCQHFVDELTMCEPAALELGCVVNDIRHVIVCGHSDCKAMNLLYALRDEEFASQVNRRISPLRAWLCAHASSSLAKFQQLEITGFHEPIIFQAETPMRKFVAYIDPEDKFAVEDKLSQVSSMISGMTSVKRQEYLKNDEFDVEDKVDVELEALLEGESYQTQEELALTINTLQQLQNVASYGFLKKRLERHDLHIHALWFDIYTGDIYYFSRANKRFVEINELTEAPLLKEIKKYYS